MRIAVDAYNYIKDRDDFKFIMGELNKKMIELCNVQLNPEQFVLDSTAFDGDLTAITLHADDAHEFGNAILRIAFVYLAITEFFYNISLINGSELSIENFKLYPLSYSPDWANNGYFITGPLIHGGTDPMLLEVIDAPMQFKVVPDPSIFSDNMDYLDTKITIEIEAVRMAKVFNAQLLLHKTLTIPLRELTLDRIQKVVLED